MELLVVIAIIGILTSVAAASYATAQKKTRDTRRINDMKAVQNAFEQYFADNASNYPATCAYAVTPTPGVMSGKYLPGGYPSDPGSAIPYPSIAAGWSRCASDSYCFCAGTEFAASGNVPSDCSGSTAPSGYNGLYCVKNLQ